MGKENVGSFFTIHSAINDPREKEVLNALSQTFSEMISCFEISFFYSSFSLFHFFFYSFLLDRQIQIEQSKSEILDNTERKKNFLYRRRRQIKVFRVIHARINSYLLFMRKTRTSTLQCIFTLSHIYIYIYLLGFTFLNFLSYLAEDERISPTLPTHIFSFFFRWQKRSIQRWNKKRYFSHLQSRFV